MPEKIKPDPGVYEKLPFDDYLAWDAVDATFLKAMAHTPHYARTKADAPQEEKDCYAKGRLYHAMVLEPARLDDEFFQQPADYQHPDDPDGVVRKWHGGAKICKEWLARHAQHTVVPSGVWDETAGMAAVARAHPLLQPFLDGAKIELSVVWVDELTGLLCKARFDAYKEGMILDLKSTSGAAAEKAWFSEADRHKYYIQSAQYIEAMKAAGLASGVPTFLFAAQEGYAPFDLAVYHVREEDDPDECPFLIYGRVKRAMLLQQVAFCIKHDSWPGYTVDSIPMQLSYRAQEELYDLTGGR